MNSSFADFVQGAFPRMANARIMATAELVRIRELPWAPWSEDADYTQSLTEYCRAPGGTQTLRRAQAAVLSALARPEFRGVLSTQRTGAGKTLPSLLAAHVTGLDNPLLIVPASMRDDTRQATYTYGQHWRVRPVRIISYETLSRPDSRGLLEQIAPNLLIADECQMLRNLSSACTNRVREYVQKHRPKQLYLSGSITNRSLKDFEHILRWIMGDAAPLPRRREELQLWCAALDVKPQERPDAGALLTLAPELPGDSDMDELDLSRSRFARRLHACPQIIGTGADIPDIPLYARIVHAPPTQPMLDLVSYFAAHKATPCGAEIIDPLAVWRKHREASCGLYLRWVKPGPKPWMEARKLWAALVRETRERYRRLDSEALVAMAIDRGEIADGGILARWREIKPTFEPVTEPVWICDSTLKIAAEWLARDRGICWVAHTAFGERLSKETGIPYFKDEGCDQRGIKISAHRGPAIASLFSCSRGFNLHEVGQHRNFYVTTPTTNSLLEQSVSRTHRDGQEQPVFAEFMQRLEGDAKALEQALADARYTETMTKQPTRASIFQWAETLRCE